MANTLKIYIVDNKYDANAKAYIVKDQNQADVIGKVVDSKYDADMKVYIVNNKYDANIKLFLESKPESGCFISTACVEAKGLPDDCYELTTLRTFRDNYLIYQENGKEMIEEYYKTAPSIVKVIDMMNNSKEKYDYLYNELVLKCINYIENNELEKAKDRYIEIFNELKRECLKNN